VTRRSGLVSLAFVAIPNIILIAFRILSPKLNEALTNDYFGQIAVHSTAIIIGMVMAFRYSAVHDHEYRRSRAISALSKTYKLEERGLWDKGEDAIQKLEARAYSDFKGRKASVSRLRMQGNIGQLNRESIELEQNAEEHSEFPISVNGIEQNTGRMEVTIQPKQNLSVRISDFFSNSIERTATRRAERSNKEEILKIDSISSFEQDDGSRWAIPKGTLKKTRFCEQCSTYNEVESSYCSSCGSSIT